MLPPLLLANHYRSNAVYNDLLSIIGNESADHADFCGGYTYARWEKTVATPLLQQQGYTVLKWVTGERDSFGPLTRIAICEKDGVQHRLVYG